MYKGDIKLIAKKEKELETQKYRQWGFTVNI